MPLKLKSAVLLLFTLCFVLLVACNEDDLKEQEGKVQFSFVINDTENARTAEVPLENLVLSIKDSDGEFILEDETLSLGFINDNYITEPISLLVGSYSLEKFLVVGNDGITYYATPLEGSDLAFLVEDPLPIAFDVATDEVIQLKPEVISTEEGTVEDFGFSEFSFEIVETFDVLLGVFVYSEEKSGFELTESNLVVYADGDSLTSKELFAATNKLTLPDRFDEFTLLIEKAEYRSFNYTFSADSLKNYQGNNANGPLEIVMASLNVAEGLIAYYPFNGNANDESGNGFDGVNDGAVLENDMQGNPNAAYRFDGIDDYIDFGNSVGDGIRSMSIWFKLDANIDNSLTSFKPLICRDTGGANLFEFAVAFVPTIFSNPETNGRIFFSVYDASGNAQIVLSESNSWASDVWYHVVATLDSDGASLIINGVEQNYEFEVDQHDMDITGVADFPVTVGSWGQRLDLTDRYFNGTLDEVRFYSRTLSLAEAQSLFSHN